jgi:hypothetical protein
MPSDLLKLHSYAAGALLVFCLFVVVTGWAPSGGSRDTAPVSVRENPASYKPVYGSSTGWIPIPVGGGGYSSGK